MSLAQVNNSVSEIDALRNEVNELKDLIARLSDAGSSVAVNMDSGAILQEVVNSA